MLFLQKGDKIIIGLKLWYVREKSLSDVQKINKYLPETMLKIKSSCRFCQ